jgi:HEPN domain-containing protein
MKTAIQEWIDKAEGDFETAIREINVPIRPNYDAVCFHAQQCAEKYLKAAIMNKEKEFPRTHDLLMLLDVLLPHEPALEVFRCDLTALSAIGIEVRYPGMCADQEDAAVAIKTAQAIRSAIRRIFRLT